MVQITLSLILIFIACKVVNSLHFHKDVEIQNLHQGDPKYSYTAYQPSVLCIPQGPLSQPRTIDEVRDLIKGAIRRNLTLKATSNHRGTRTDLICSQGLTFETPNFKHIKISSKGKTVRVGTGVKVKELFEYLHEKGYTLETATTFGGLTIGGGIGVAAHGTSLNHAGCMGDLLVGITVIDGEGELRKVITPVELNAFKCHLGLLGFIVDARFKIVPNFKIAIQNTLHPESYLMDGSALMTAKASDFFQMFWFPSTNEVVTSEGTHVPADTPGNVRNTLMGKMSANATLVLRNIYERAQATNNIALLKRLNEYGKRSLIQKVHGREPMLTEDGETLKNPGVGWAKDILTSECGENCRWDYGDNSLYDSWDEIGIDLERLDRAVIKLKEIFNYYKAIFPWLGIFIRFAKKSDGYMAMSRGRDTAFLEITTPMRLDRFQNPRSYLEAIQSFVQCLVNDFDGRPHWAKNGLHYHSTKMIEKHEGLDLFKSAMKKFDPNGIFLNYFGLRLLGKSNLTNVHPKVDRCALEQNCECTKNEDCPLARECKTNSFGYKVCSLVLGI